MAGSGDASGLEDTTADPNASTVGGDAAPRGDNVFERGASLGRYLILDRLGSGGMGVVYRAYDPELDRKLAIKLLRPAARATADDGDPRARLQREAQAMARLAHPNVISVFDVGTLDDQVFVVMELVSGMTLRAWLKAERRPWRVILEKFMQAGRGLAAAHAAGLVHRDFKPDNVLVSDDGRVRVLDFGLARAAHEQEVRVEAPAPSLRDSSPSMLATPLTRTGSFLGTPQYMSPEQWRHQPADARADQFSFCVALYEAWYRQPPFLGSSVAALGYAVLENQLQQPPVSSDVPVALRDAVLRGLRIDPAERHPSIEALLDQLTAGSATPRRRLWWIAGAAVVGASVAVTGALTRSAGTHEDVCGGARDKLAGIWDVPRKHAVQAAFAATHVPYQADAWRGVERAFDDYADRWTTMHTDACKATHVRGEQSAELLDLRMACLSRRLDEFSAQVAVATEATAATMTSAVEAARSLGGLELCSDTAALKEAVPLPADPALRARITATRSQLARAEALSHTGRYADATTILPAAVRDARAIGFAPLLAEALAAFGDLQERDGDSSAADATLHAAVLAAETANDRRLEAIAWTSLVFVANQQSRFADGKANGEHARALLATGNVDRERSALFVELGNLADSQGESEEAIKLYQEALAIRIKLVGPDDPSVASVLDNLGLALVALGRYEEGLAQHQRALAIGEKALGPDHPDVATSLSNVGIALHMLHRDDEALTYHRRALAIQERVLGPTHRDLGGTLDYIGDVLAAQHRPTDALVYYRRALAIEEAALGSDHPNLAYDLLGIAEAELALDHAGPALELFERALALRTAHPGRPTELAEAQFAVARALTKAKRDPARARALATQARAGYADEEAAHDELAAVDRWLATHAR